MLRLSIGVFAVLESNTTYHVGLGLFTDQMEGELTSWTVHTPLSPAHPDVSHTGGGGGRKRQLLSALSNAVALSLYRATLATVCLQDGQINLVISQEKTVRKV